MAPASLHQVIAIEKGVVAQAERDLTDVYHEFQKPKLYEGQSRVYTPKDEAGDQLPNETKLVQRSVETQLQEVAEALSGAFDATARKDFANCHATADVEVDGQVLLKAVPVTYLLWLEKQLKGLKTGIGKIPTLDPAYRWTPDEAGGFRTDAVETQKTQKVPEVIRLAKPTEHHAEQAQLVTVDKTVGTWATVKQSGAVSADRRKELLRRVVKLQEAVKAARAKGNAAEAERQTIGKPVFEYLLAR